jgi:hypothetical protein
LPLSSDADCHLPFRFGQMHCERNRATKEKCESSGGAKYFENSVTVVVVRGTDGADTNTSGMQDVFIFTRIDNLIAKPQ